MHTMKRKRIGFRPRKLRPVLDQLLTTKLFTPHLHHDLVLRRRLLERLDEALRHKIMLISAPAGFGKTTLVSEWAVNCEGQVAWLSLDKGDSDLRRFLSYMVAALQTIMPSLGEGIMGVLQAPQTPPINSIMTLLVNEISATSNRFILVLDDYHELDSIPIDQAIIFLLDHLPPQMHVVIATREDPNFPLARMRARGQLAELRITDLRFDYAETSAFLNEVMGIHITHEEVESLETRTEGWIAGLQLAALSMRGREDISAFIRAFAGDHHYIVDYLVEEVLQRQPESIRKFLLQTSILARLNGPLCEVVTGQGEGRAMLETLERSNLFVIPLDDRRQWFRYHQLFADTLQAHLMTEQPDALPELHQRASAWYVRNNLPDEAIHHALTGKDFVEAANLVERAWAKMDQRRQSARWLEWAKRLPEALVRASPVLSVGYAWALLDGGALEEAEMRLTEAERWLGTPAYPEHRAKMIVADEEEFQSLPATIASARAYIALAHGDVAGTVAHARQALDFLSEASYQRRGTPAALLSLASWANGDLKAADQALAEAMTDFQKAGNILFAITGTFSLAEISLTRGHLRRAFDAFQQSLRLAADHGKAVLWGTADLYTGLSDLFREQNELETAAKHLAKSKAIGENTTLPRWRYRWCLANARLKASEADLEGALAYLEEAEQNYVRGPVPDVRPVAALKTCVRVALGQLDEAWAWVQALSLSPHDPLSFLREFEHLTLARVLIAQFRDTKEEEVICNALSLLKRLLIAAKEGERMGTALEILILQTLAFEAQGEMPSAVETLARALNLAEPEGYLRIFADEGAPMLHVLSEANRQGILPGYTQKLLLVMHAPEVAKTLVGFQALIEPLSTRELEVLRLIAEGLSNREISARLFLALSTIKGYNQTIFSKLHVQRRTEAVARARELGVL